MFHCESVVNNAENKLSHGKNKRYFHKLHRSKLFLSNYVKLYSASQKNPF